MMFKRLLSVTVKPGVDHIDWIIWHLYSPESDPSPPNKHTPSPLSCYPHHRHTCRQTQAMTKLYHHYYLNTTATECEHKQTSCERKCLCPWVRFVQPPEGSQLKAIFFCMRAFIRAMVNRRSKSTSPYPPPPSDLHCTFAQTLLLSPYPKHRRPTLGYIFSLGCWLQGDDLHYGGGLNAFAWFSAVAKGTCGTSERLMMSLSTLLHFPFYHHTNVQMVKQINKIINFLP